MSQLSPVLRPGASLRTRILFPILSALAAAFVLITVQYRLSFRKELAARFRGQSERIAEIIQFTAGWSDDPAELQRLVGALSGQPDVNEIDVVAGEPLRVIASSKVALIGQPLPRAAMHDSKHLDETIRTSVDTFDFDLGEDEIDFYHALPVAIRGPTGPRLERGVAMVHLDRRRVKNAMLLATATSFAGSAVALLLIAFCTWILLSRHVLKPLAEIAANVERFDWDETTRVRSPTRFSVEIARLAGTWNDVVDRLAGEEAERRAALERLNASLRELKDVKTALDAHAIVALTDERGHITYANDKFCEISRYSRDELVGQDHRVLNSGYHPKDFVRDLWSTITSGAIWRGDFCDRAKDGSIFWVDTTIVPFLNAEGKPWQYAAIRTAITEKKAVEAAMIRARDAAEAATRAKSEFLANMSHEIRTPMNGVIGMTGLLLDTELSKEQADIAETIRSSAESLLTIINDILDFSKIEAGKLTFEALDFDLDEAVDGTLEMVAGAAQQKGLDLGALVEPAVARRLYGDPGRLRQVLLNLLNNAIKFTTRGAVSVRVSVDRTAEPETEPPSAATPETVRLRFEIKDSGVGISKDARERLFQPFIQADSSTSRKFGGTGLGLAISRQIVERMGGAIGVESEPGKGSTFWFTVRLAVAVAAQPSPAEARELRDMRVLVVGDDETSRRFAFEHVIASGMGNGRACDGGEAIALLRDAAARGEPYPVALIDLRLPEMQGLALARAIKADPAIAGTRLIALTPFGTPLPAETAATCGIAGSLMKPVRRSALVACIDTVLGASEGGAAPKSRLAPDERDPLGNSGGVSGGRRPTAGKRVLVAEDNPVNLRVAVGQLKKLGYSADAVANGLEALAALERIPYDVVLMDCQMPEMDGYEATAEIRKRENGKRHVWIVAMTANAMRGDRERCLAAGMDDYVSKPTKLVELEAAIARRPANVESMRLSA